MTRTFPLRSILLLGVLLALAALLSVVQPGSASAQDNNCVTGGRAFWLVGPELMNWGIWIDDSGVWISRNFDPVIVSYKPGGEIRSSYRDIHLDGHDDARGIWSDGVTMWVVDNAARKVLAYSLAGRARDGSKDVPLHGENRGATGLWVNLDTRLMYVADWEDDRLYVYNMDTGGLVTQISVGFSGNNNPEGIWSDGRTMWVADLHDNRMFAYDLADGRRDTSREFDLYQDSRGGNGDPRGVFSNGRYMWVVDDIPKGHYYNRRVFAYDVRCVMSYDDLRLANTGPSGMWSDGTTTWVADWKADKIYAYTTDGNRRLRSQDFDTLAAAGNHAAHGIWSDGTTMWVADWDDRKLYAYSMATKARDPGKDIDLHSDNAKPLDIWSDGTTMYVGDAEDKKIYAYTFAGARKPGRDIGFDSGINPFGIWSNGSVMWVTDGASDTIFAYTLDGRRHASWDVELKAGNGNPRGIWSDGTTMRVLEHSSSAVFDYTLRSAPPIEFSNYNYNSQTSGIWSNGRTIWVSNWGYDTIYGYIRGGSEHRPNRDFTTLGAAGNGDPHGIWSDGATMWVADWNDPKLYAYNKGTKARDPDRDIPLHADNARAMDIWSDGATMYVADAEDRKIYAYTMEGERQSDKDIGVPTDFGIWSNGSVMWTADGGGGYLRAHTMTGERRTGLDIPLDAGNNAPRGIWSDGETMYALQSNVAGLFTYRMPPDITLSLAPSGITEEGGRQTVRARVGLTGGWTVPSSTTASLSVAHGTTDDGDFTSTNLPAVTIGAGSGSGEASLIFEPGDDEDDEGRETLTITATMTYPGIEGSLTARATLTLSDDDPVPTTVPDLAAGPVAGETTKLQVSWGSVPDAEQYRVEHKSGGGSYSTVARSDASSRTETLTGLTADTTYTVRVTAIDTDGGSSADLVSTETTGTTLDAMGAVTVSAVADNHNSLDVSWPAVNGATGYRVEWKAPGGSYNTVTRSDATATTERLTGLTPKTGYAVRVTALHTIAGKTADGDSARGTGATGSDRTVSVTDAAGALRVEQLFSAGIDLLWDPVATVDGNAVTGYTIEWAANANGPWVALDYSGEGAYCIANMTIDYLTSGGQTSTRCYFQYGLAGDKITRGNTYYYRLIAHAEDVDSKPGPVRSRRVDIGGL